MSHLIIHNYRQSYYCAHNAQTTLQLSRMFYKSALFMQNKPNFRYFLHKNEGRDEKQSQFKPNQSQYKPKKSQNKPNSNPKIKDDKFPLFYIRDEIRIWPGAKKTSI